MHATAPQRLTSKLKIFVSWSWECFRTFASKKWGGPTSNIHHRKVCNLHEYVEIDRVFGALVGVLILDEPGMSLKDLKVARSALLAAPPWRALWAVSQHSTRISKKWFFGPFRDSKSQKEVFRRKTRVFIIFVLLKYSFIWEWSQMACVQRGLPWENCAKNLCCLWSTSIHILSIPIWISIKSDTEKCCHWAQRAQFFVWKITLENFSGRRISSRKRCRENSFRRPLFFLLLKRTPFQKHCHTADKSLKEWSASLHQECWRRGDGFEEQKNASLFHFHCGKTLLKGKETAGRAQGTFFQMKYVEKIALEPFDLIFSEATQERPFLFVHRLHKTSLQRADKSHVVEIKLDSLGFADLNSFNFEETDVCCECWQLDNACSTGIKTWSSRVVVDWEDAEYTNASGKSAEHLLLRAQSEEALQVLVFSEARFQAYRELCGPESSPSTKQLSPTSNSGSSFLSVG